MIIGSTIFIFGLIFGSFLNALEYRITKKKSMAGRSACPNCKHELSFSDLVPVVSWILLFGKCRYCKKRISTQYPLIELLTGFAFLFAGLQTSLIHKLNEFIINYTSTFPVKELTLFIILASVFFILILIALHDAKTKYVLSMYTYAAMIFAIAYQLLNYSGAWSLELGANYFWPIILAMIIPAGLFFALSFGSNGKWMGAGDSEIALAIGALLGWTLILPAYYFAFIVGAIWSLIQIAKKKAKMKTAVPLGPFLIAGTFFSLAFGEQLVDWYVKIILGI